MSHTFIPTKACRAWRTGGAQAEHRHGAGGSNWIELLAALLSTVANLLIYAIYRDFMGRESSQIISNHAV